MNKFNETTLTIKTVFVVGACINDYQPHSISHQQIVHTHQKKKKKKES
jgi:accessory gene regulator protein AgrB